MEDEPHEVPCLTDDNVPILLCQSEENDEEAPSFVMTVFTGVELEVFIGLAVTPGWALVDTGAQHGVLGPQAYQQIFERLVLHGLKPRIIDTLQLTASGVGALPSSSSLPRSQLASKE